MANKKDIGTNKKVELNKHQQTSIGHSNNTNPKNKHKKKNWKKYRGQGK
jgi:hypothetical protein